MSGADIHATSVRQPLHREGKLSLIPGSEPSRKYGLPLASLRQQGAGASAVVGWGAFVWSAEPEPVLLLAVIVLHLATALLLAALLRRPRFAFALTTCLLLAVYVASRAKFALVAMNLHVYDLAFYFSRSPIEFFFSAYPRHAWLMTLALAMSAAGLYALWRREPPRTYSRKRRSSFVALSLCLGLFGPDPVILEEVTNVRHNVWLDKSSVAEML